MWDGCFGDDKQMKRILLASALLAAAACSGGQPAGESMAPASTELPPCADAEGDGTSHPDCRLIPKADGSATYTARFTAGSGDAMPKLAIDVVTAGGETIQTVEEELGGTFGSPHLSDLDGDGREDVVVAMETGNTGTVWSLWLAATDGQLTSLGEVSGESITHSARGQVVVPARASSDLWSVAFLAVTDGRLVPVATAFVSAKMASDGGADSIDCTLTDDGGLGSAGLTVEQAQQEFCSEKAVLALFGDGAN